MWAVGRSVADIKRWSLMAPVGSQKYGMRPIGWQGMTLKTCTCSFQWNVACLHLPYMLPLIFFNLCSYRNVVLVYKASTIHAVCSNLVLLHLCPVTSAVCLPPSLCSVITISIFCKFLFWISISEVTVVGSVSFAFTWDYQLIVSIISTNFLFKTVYWCGLLSLSLGYSFHSLWSNFIYNILTKTYISSSQSMENRLIL